MAMAIKNHGGIP